MSHTPDDTRQRFHGDQCQLRIVGRRWSRYNEQTDCEQDDVSEVDVIKLDNRQLVFIISLLDLCLLLVWQV